MNHEYLAAALLTLSCISIGMGLMWTIAWLNQLVLFAMKIYKDENSHIQPQYAIVPSLFFGLAFWLWRVGSYFFAIAANSYQG
jgi:hypothetical protein